MSEITIYTGPMCPYCSAALKLLSDKGLDFEEIQTASTPGARSEMIKRANGGSTVPQIFIGDTHVGGCTELLAANASGELDTLLANG